MVKRAIPEIHGYLQEVGFLHASNMSGGYKLDLHLIDTLMERWRPGTHNFHLSCDECTIILEDVVLQLGLPVDGIVIMGSGIISDKVTFCQSLLRKVPNKFESGRISVNWLKDNFNELLEDPEDQTNEVI